LVVAISSTAGVTGVAFLIARRDATRRFLAVPWVPLEPIGFTLFVLGLALRVWATRVFWVHGRGTPVPPMVPTHLITNGPYAWSRNPLYVGTAALCAGMALAFRSPLLLTVTALGFVGLRLLVVPWEERVLLNRFGAPYCHYLERVPRWV
jgi:protein-S-isoprenylcysteine O-methyltransferase Ste14